MHPERAETDSPDEYEGWDPLDSESDLDADLLTGWRGLNSSVSSFIRKVTESNAQTGKQSGSANLSCGAEKSNADGTPPDLSSGSSDSSHSEIPTKPTSLVHSPDFAATKPSLLPDVPGATTANDHASLDDDAPLALVVRHLAAPANPWRSIAGAICILTVAVIGISYYICIYQSVRNRGTECPLVQDCARCPGTAETGVCRIGNSSVYHSPINKKEPRSDVPAAGKEHVSRISKCLFPFHFELDAVPSSTRWQTVRLRHLLRELRLEMAYMRRRSYRLTAANFELMKTGNAEWMMKTAHSPATHAQEQQTRKQHIPPSMETSGQQMAMHQPFVKEQQINSLNRLDASISKLDALVQKMHLLRTASIPDKVSAWQTNRNGEQVTTRRIHKRIRKWATSLSQAITSFVGTIEKTLRKMDEFISSACPESSDLSQVKSRAPAWSHHPPASWFSHFFAAIRYVGNQEQCTQQRCPSFCKSKGAEQSANLRGSKHKLSEYSWDRSVFSGLPKDKSGNSLSTEDDEHVGWQFQASDQRKALRDRESYHGFAPSWIFRRSNKRGSLRHHDV